ncbi:RidA family protein [Anaerolineales bacterium HSG6]|nr:RidA family protein [Anaerolineales bacterium HSG6]MDM8531512.1 RidA family protein [Anaerolineales bacterium HSG25]
MSNQRNVISTNLAPAAVGPYSQAIQTGNLIYTAGQIPLVPETGKMVEGGIQAQTNQVMKNLSNILDAAGSSLANIVKTTIFVTDLADFATINEIYGSFFDGAPPARSTVQVAALPLGSQVEIEAIATIS